MPIFEKPRILFLHIPKTGGTSVEQYFSNKYSTRLNSESLFGNSYNSVRRMVINKMKNTIYTISLQHHTRISLQHYTWKMLQEHELIQNLTAYKIITIVRNPYNRIISELFYQKIITKDATPEIIYSKIYNYLHVPNNSDFDNHRIPQYKFLIDENENIIKYVIILKTETLTSSMRKLGYTDFPEDKANASVSVSDSDIHEYLNTNSVNLINTYYQKDFEYFDYVKREPGKGNPGSL